MTTNDAQNSWLIADVGATSSRCGIYTPIDRATRDVQIFKNDDFADLLTLLSAYHSNIKVAPVNCALGVAAAVDSDDVRMVNRDWTFCGADIGKRFKLKQVKIINDFHAVAFALPELHDEDRVEIGHATAYRNGTIAVLGPGSGLGMAAWIKSETNTAAMFGEGGHISVSGRDAAEDRIIVAFRERFGHCSAERILSGPGLITLHSVMHGIDVATSEEITSNADDQYCAATLNQFFQFLGSAAADLALITGAYGGVYIAGGIVPACVSEIRTSGFRSRFEAKNRYTNYMQAIPTWVITAAEPGLIGLAAYVDRCAG
ncbi:MAG: glucokinase [Woeseiaceae bacterium]